MKKILVALAVVGAVGCWAGVPSVHAQDLMVKDGNMPAAGVNVLMLALLGKAGSGSSGMTDNNGVPSNTAQILNSGASSTHLRYCRDDKTLEITPSGQKRDDRPCAAGWFNIPGTYYPGRGSATIQIGGGAGVYQQGSNFGAGGPFTPGAGEFWFGGYLGPTFINRGFTAFDGEGELGYRYAPKKCFAFGPLVGGGGTNSIRLDHFGGPNGGSMPITFENFFGGLANFKIGADLSVGLPHGFIVDFNVLAVDTFERDKVVSGTCLGNTCTPSFTDTAHSASWGPAGGASLKHQIWNSPSWKTEMDGVVGYEYYGNDARENSLRFGVEMRFSLGGRF